MRDPLDRYYTPEPLAKTLVHWTHETIAQEPPDFVLEPCAGDGVFGRMAMQVFSTPCAVRGCDVDPDATPGYPWDQVSVEAWRPQTEGNTWILTNPHYTGVYETISRLRNLQNRTQARLLGLLLRATTIEQMMNLGDPPHILAVSDIRPRWRGPGGALHPSGDTCGSVWCIWTSMNKITSGSNLHGLPHWREKRSRKNKEIT